MTVHIAATGENRGRLLVWMPACGDIPAVAMADAIAVAGAYSAEIETLNIRDGALQRAAGFSFAKHIAWGEQPVASAFDGTGAEHQFNLLADRTNRDFARAARRRSVPFLSSTATGEGLEPLEALCRERGPWNAIVLPDAGALHIAARIEAIFTAIDGITAIIVPGDTERPPARPAAIVAIVEDHDGMSSILRVAERLSASTYLPVKVAVVAKTAEDARWLDSQARLLDSGIGAISFEPATVAENTNAPVSRLLQRLRPRFVIGRFGGAAAPASDELPGLIRATGATHFIVR